MSHASSNFAAAVSVLAGHGHIKQRLIRAYDDNLGRVEEDELPVAVKQPFADLKQLMHRVAPLNGEGPICASVRKMSLDEAAHCAQLMVDLYGATMACADDGQAPLPLSDEDSPKVPPFLVKSG